MNSEDEEKSDRGDYDLIAIRMPNVYEEIGGKPEDWDKRFEDWEIPLSDKKLGLIVEVKSSQNVSDINAFEREKRIEMAIQRMGCLPKNDIQSIVEELMENSQSEIDDDWIIAKLLITQSGKEGNWFNLTLKEANDFIEKRIRKYHFRKFAERMFFHDELFQYKIWKDGN